MSIKTNDYRVKDCKCKYCKEGYIPQPVDKHEFAKLEKFIAEKKKQNEK